MADNWMSSKHGGLTGGQWLGLAGAGGSALGSFLGGSGGDSANGPMAALQKNADASTELSSTLAKQSQDLLGPASDWLKKLLSGDRQDLLAATGPERRRVIDQYSAAKKSLAEFTPRGGGQAGAMAKLQSDQAADLAGITSGARPMAAQAATAAGTAVGQQAQSASQAASSNLMALIQALQNQDQQKSANASQWGELAGTLAMLAFI